MKYFNKEWFEEKYKPYFDFMEKNYEFYPKWFRDYDIARKREFLFKDAMLSDVTIDDDKIVLEMVGIDYMLFKPYYLVCENVKKYHFPDDVKDAGYDIVAEELYCDENGMDLNFLLYDEGETNEDFHIECDRIGIQYIKNPLEAKLLFNLLKKEIKRRKRNYEVFY